MISKLVSERALKLESYKVESRVPGISLDKNELPWSLTDKLKNIIAKSIMELEFNRYPDNECKNLKLGISGYTGVGIDCISVGNGSDELINMIFQAFVNPEDVIAVTKPTFSMYEFYGKLCGASIWEYVTNNDFKFRLEEYIESIQKENIKLAVLCSPNNPTGSRLEVWEIEKILESFKGILLVDEAYFEFSDCTAAGLLSRYSNLIILRTFSKALGMAGMRVGYIMADPAVINYIERVRSPFNVNAFSMAVAAAVLKNIDIVAERAAVIKQERARLLERLIELEGLESFESWGNFILLRSPYACEIQQKLLEEGIFIKSFSSPVLEDCIRVTVGSPEENDLFCEKVKEVLYDRAL